MNKLEAITRTAPSHWASYLINSDASGMSDGEIEACDAWIECEELPQPCDCEDAGFIKYHDAYPYVGLAADCQRYTFLVVQS